MLNSIRRAAAHFFARPYVSRELPAWGHVYRLFVEDDSLWVDHPEIWVRGKLHGYEMPLRIGGWSNRATYFLRRFYDLPTQLLIQESLNPGDTFVDIGANEGMMSLVASHAVGSEGKVIAFEPNPLVRSIFERTIARNCIGNIDLRPAGLSDKAGELSLFVPERNSGEGTFTTLQGLPGENVDCPVLVGDDALEQTHPALIKIDVEGFEARVLRGLAKTLERTRCPISIELIGTHLARDGESPQSIVQFLQELGYEGRRLALDGRKSLALRPISEPWTDGDYVFTSTVSQDV